MQHTHASTVTRTAVVVARSPQSEEGAEAGGPSMSSSRPAEKNHFFTQDSAYRDDPPDSSRGAAAFMVANGLARRLSQ